MAGWYQKYIWMKHLFDPRVLYGTFDYANGGCSVDPYVLGEGPSGEACRISAEYVEWAHIASQSYLPKMQEIAELAIQQDLLVDLWFIDNSHVGKFLVKECELITRPGTPFTAGSFNRSNCHGPFSVYGYFVGSQISMNPTLCKIPSSDLQEVYLTELDQGNLCSDRKLELLDWQKRFIAK